MRILAGTSGWSYPPWRGRFYPPDLPGGHMLAAYAARLPAVEVNASSYRLPPPAQLEAWRAQVPPAFRFALKAPRWMTGGARLSVPDRALAALVSGASAMGQSLSAVLVQLPPEQAPDVPRLEALLARLPRGVPAAVEVKNLAWLGDPLLRALSTAGVALCVTDAEERETPLVATAAFGYLRLRRASYDDASLARWSARIAAQPWREAVVFFRHEDTAAGTRFAERLMAIAGESAPRIDR